MSNNIYNILNKLKAVAGLDKPAEPTAPKQTVYESVEARGSITETVKALESKYASFKEGRKHSDKDAFDANAKVGDTYKTAKGTVTKTDKGIKHERGVGKHDEEDTELDEAVRAMNTYTGGRKMDSQMDRNDTAASVRRERSINRRDLDPSDPKRKGAASGNDMSGQGLQKVKSNPMFSRPASQGKFTEGRRESEYDANEWLGSQRSVKEDDTNEGHELRGVHQIGDDEVYAVTPARGSARFHVHGAINSPEDLKKFKGWYGDEMSTKTGRELKKLIGKLSSTTNVYDRHTTDLDEASNAIVGIVTHRNGRERVSTGTIQELVQSFSYTLEVGKSYEHERGNAKINMNPKNVEALAKHLTNAKNNAAANGYSGTYYSVASPEQIASAAATATAPDAVNEEGNAKGNEFNYQLLGRLRSDCDYFLGAGNRSERQLWAGNVADQIAKMKELWSSFPEDSKPQWLSKEDIMQYEKDMGAGHPEGFGPEDEVQDHDLRADPSKPAYIKKVTEEGDERDAYDIADPKHPDFADNYYVFKATRPDCSVADYIAHLTKKSVTEGKIDDLKDAKAEKEEGNWWDNKKAEKKDTRTVVKGKAYGGSKQKDDEDKEDLDEAFDAPEAPDNDAIARRKRLQALKDKREDGAGAGDDWNAPLSGSAKRVVKGSSYGGANQRDNAELDEGTGEDDVATVYKMAHNEGLILEPGEVTAAKRFGNKFKVVGYDGNENQWLLCSFYVNDDGQSGDFGGAPDDTFATEEEAIAALNALGEASNLPVHSFGKMQGKPDARYTINKEFTGAPKAQHVVRFARDLVSAHDDEEGASTAARAHKAQRDATLEGVEFGDKIKNSRAQMKKVPMKLKESKMLNEGVETVLSRFPHEVKQFEAGSELDDDLYHALYDYYFSNGEMPYGVAKARSGDPYEWIAQQLQKEMGIGESMIADIHQSNIPAPTNNMPVSKELDEIAALAGLARPVATAVATNVASNLIDETADSTEVDDVLSKVGTGELDAYDVMNRPQGPAQVEASKVLNDMYDDISIDYRLHPDDQFEEIIDIMCNQLSDDYPSLAETEQESEFFRNPLGTRTVGETDDDFPAAPEETEPLVLEQDEDAVPRERNIEYTNSPREKVAGVQAAIPSGTDQSRIKKQYRKEYPGDNHMAVKEDALWKSYQDMLNSVTKK